MTEILPPYILKRNARSRTVRVSVSAGGKVKVSAPRWTTEATIKKFLLDHAAWLRQKVEHFKKFPQRNKLTLTQEKKLYILHKAKAKTVAEAKVKQWNEQFKFVFSRISIRKSRTRWGSCSSKGTLCFNYKIAFLPEHLADYLVVHELCHLREKNHGKGFWSLVAGSIPQYASHRKELRNFEISFKSETDDIIRV